jgi:hypothetical protein
VTLAAIWRSRKFNQQKVAWRPECAMVVAARRGGFLGTDRGAWPRFPVAW